jgi:hypothetical protein
MLVKIALPQNFGTKTDGDTYLWQAPAAISNEAIIGVSMKSFHRQVASFYVCLTEWVNSGNLLSVSCCVQTDATQVTMEAKRVVSSQRHVMNDVWVWFIAKMSQAEAGFTTM